MELAEELRRLEKRLKIQGAVVTLVVVWLLAGWVISALSSPLTDVKVVRDGESVRISSMSDGPFIVTHLTVNGRDAGSEGDKRTAALPEPIACIDSGGIRIEDISELDWRDISGRPASPPNSGIRLTALLIRPEYIGPPEK